jgi:hypothetical protein
MNLQRAKSNHINSVKGTGWGEGGRRRRAFNIAYAYPYPSSSKHILAWDIAFHLSYTASSNLHERILEYLATEYPY